MLVRVMMVHRRLAHPAAPMKGVCGGCGYDLKGLGEGAACPECGKGDKKT